MRRLLAMTLVAGLACAAAAPLSSLCRRAWAQEEADEVKSQLLLAGGDPGKRVHLIGPAKDAPPPKDGFGLILVLPGGTGDESFLPFVKNIYKQSVPADFLAAQWVAVKWTPDQQAIWPTRQDKVAKSRFATEDFILAAIKAVGGKHQLNPRRVFTFSWSSGGWAAWHASFLKEIRGSFIAMAVFYPDQLPPLSQARGRVYYLYHSPEDEVCRFAMAEAARDALTRNGALVRLTTYAGGHGWHGGPVHPDRRGALPSRARPRRRLHCVHPGQGCPHGHAAPRCAAGPGDRGRPERPPLLQRG